MRHLMRSSFRLEARPPVSLEGHRSPQSGWRCRKISAEASARRDHSAVLVTPTSPARSFRSTACRAGFTPVILRATGGRASHPNLPSALADRAADHGGTGRQTRIEEDLPDRGKFRPRRGAPSRRRRPDLGNSFRREEILHRYPTIADAVRGVRGMFTWNDRKPTSRSACEAGRLGSYTNRELVLLDGHPTNETIGSAYVGFRRTHDLADLERIEVVRGPGPSLWYECFLGILNLVTVQGRRPAQRWGSRLSAQAWAAAECAHKHEKGRLGKERARQGSGEDFYFPSSTAPRLSRRPVPRRRRLRCGTVQGRVSVAVLTASVLSIARQGAADRRVRHAARRSAYAPGRHPRFSRGPRGAFLSRYVQLLSALHWNLYRFRGD